MKPLDRLDTLRIEIQKTAENVGRSSKDIRLIAVSKFASIDQIKWALASGITDFGENRVPPFLDKKKVIEESVPTILPTWHFIGNLQTRKVKEIIHQLHYLHSLDRLSLAEEIEKRAERPIKCFLQVNTSGEDSKQGLSPDEVVPFLQSIQGFQKVRIVGLMTMAPLTENEVLIRHCFQQLKKIQLSVLAFGFPHAPCGELSMGMSNDFKIAIEEGATMIRLGTALFGND